VMHTTIVAYDRCSVRVYSHKFCRGSWIIYILFILIYAHWCSPQFPYHMMFVSLQ